MSLHVLPRPRWLAKQPKARTIDELQVKLDRFGAYYNTVRPHRAIDKRTPAEACVARPKAGPTLEGFVVPAFRVQRDKVDITAVITLRLNSRLHHIGLGRRLAWTRVVVFVADLDVRVLTEDGELLRALTLDPNRDYRANNRPERATTSRDRCQRCPETSRSRAGQDSNPRPED